MKRIPIIVCLTLTAAISPHKVYSQASLAAENIVDDIKVTSKGATDTYTLIRDGRLEDQWYYVPNEPRIVEKEFDGKIDPEFTLLRYQFPNPNSPDKLVEDGILQFATTLAAPSDELDQMRSALAAKKSIDATKLRLAALPLKSAEVAIYTPSIPGESSTLLSDAVQGAGIAPVFANQKSVFALSLTKAGSDVLEQIVRGHTGIPMAVVYTYLGLTAPAELRVEVNWDNAFNHFSSDSRFRARASYFGFFGASYDSSSQNIVEEMIGHKDIKVSGITSENYSQADLDKILQPLLARINTELGEAFTPPPAIDPAHASAPDAGGYFGSVGYSSATKEVKIKKSGTETFEFSIQSIAERKTVASGFIGIGAYPKEVQDRLVTKVPRGPFKSAYFALPPTSGLDLLDVSEADLEVGIENGNDKSGSQLVTWIPGSGWMAAGKPRQNLIFGLLGNGVDDPDFANTKFFTHLTLTTPFQVFESSQELDAFDGERAMRSIGKPAYDIVEVDASNLTFRQINPQSKLVAVNVSIKCGDDSISEALRPSNVNGVKSSPAPFRWLLPKQSGDVGQPTLTATIEFQLADGTMIDWKRNGQNLHNVLPNPYIYLDDTAYSP